MLTEEEQMLIDRLKRAVSKIGFDYAAGRMTEEEYQKNCKLIEDAADNIEAISKS